MQKVGEWPGRRLGRSCPGISVTASLALPSTPGAAHLTSLRGSAVIPGVVSLWTEPHPCHLATDQRVAWLLGPSCRVYLPVAKTAALRDQGRKEANTLLQYSVTIPTACQPARGSSVRWHPRKDRPGNQAGQGPWHGGRPAGPPLGPGHRQVSHQETGLWRWSQLPGKWAVTGAAVPLAQLGVLEGM